MRSNKFITIEIQAQMNYLRIYQLSCKSLYFAVPGVLNQQIPSYLALLFLNIF